MKTFTIYAMTAILLVGLATSASAQPFREPAMNTSLYRPAPEVDSVDSVERFQEIMFSSTAQFARNYAIRQNMLSSWTRDGAIQFIGNMLRHEDSATRNETVLEALGISQEQSRKMIQIAELNIRNDPDLQALHEKNKQLSLDTPGGLFAKDTPIEVQQQYAVLNQRIGSVAQSIRDEVIHEVSTPDQLQTIREYQIATMSEHYFVFPSMFEALDLSDEQKDQLEKINGRLQSEFEKNVDRYLEWDMPRRQRFDKLFRATTQEEKDEIRPDITEMFRQRDSQREEIQESSKALVNRLKIEMFDVLTDEQWARMVQLIDNPPDHIKKIIAQMRARLPNTNPSADVWMPGPGAWQPGSSAIPEQYRQERNTRSRFPRGEN